MPPRGPKQASRQILVVLPGCDNTNRGLHAVYYGPQEMLVAVRGRILRISQKRGEQPLLLGMLRLPAGDRPLDGIGQFALKQQVRLDHDTAKTTTGDFCQRFGQGGLRHGQEADEEFTSFVRLIPQAGEFMHLSRGRLIAAAAADENQSGFGGRNGRALCQGLAESLAGQFDNRRMAAEVIGLAGTKKRNTTCPLCLGNSRWSIALATHFRKQRPKRLHHCRGNISFGMPRGKEQERNRQLLVRSALDQSAQSSSDVRLIQFEKCRLDGTGVKPISKLPRKR